MKNSITFLLIFLLIFFSCKQKSKNMNEVNSSNYVEYMLAKVKHYDIEPEYLIRIGNNTMYEVLVNDIPVAKHYRETQLISPIEINYAILKSGPQKVTFRLYPFENKGFEDDSGINVRILIRDKKDVNRLGLGKAPENLVLEKEIYIKKKGEKYYEGEITFDAKIPYENQGWNDGQDLTKFDQRELETAVVAFYQKMRNIYSDKNRKDDIYKYIQHKDIEIISANYEKKEDIKERHEVYLRPYTNSTYDLQPLENYKMVFYGEGKIVALQQTNMDIRLRGKLALWAKYSEEGEKTIRTSFPSLYLYLPQGKKLEDGLQIIR